MTGASLRGKDNSTPEGEIVSRCLRGALNIAASHLDYFQYTAVTVMEGFQGYLNEYRRNMMRVLYRRKDEKTSNDLCSRSK